MKSLLKIQKELSVTLVSLFVLNQRMKTTMFFVVILSIHTASTFPQCGRPRSFTGELQYSYAILMNILGYTGTGSHKFNRAHVVPWEKIKEKVYAKDPSVSYSRWTNDVDFLIQDLHVIDPEWFGNKKLQGSPQERVKYRRRNDANKRNCKGDLGKIDRTQIHQMQTTNKPTQEMNDLCKCLFSAPANIRPGYKVTNNLVGSYFDPLTTSKPTKNDVVTCNDITRRSKTIAKNYKLRFLQYKRQYRGEGIVTSDQAPKVTSRKLLLKTKC